MTRKSSAPSMVGVTLAMLFAVTACGQTSAGQEADIDTEAQEEHSEDPASRQSQEVSAAQPRLGITYDGGVAILDGGTLETVAEFDAEGFLRLNPAGDGRYMFLTEGDSFRLLDAGAWGVPLSFLSSGFGEIVVRFLRYRCLVEGAVAQHGIQRIEAPPG